MKFHYKEVADSVLDVKIDKRTEVFNFGADNAFPSLIEALIRMSVTSKICVDKISKAIYGKSFGKLGKVIVNSKGQSLNEVLRIAGRWYAKQNNCYLQVTYDGNFDVKGIVVLPVTDVRIGKADDKGYSGKFIVYDNWDKSKGKMIQSKSFVLCDRFNSDKEVIEKQVLNSRKDKKGVSVGEIEDYNGQIIHIRKDETFKYSLSDLEPVMSEALLENNSQVFRSKGAEDGFINTKLMTTAPFKDGEARKEFKKDMDGLRGAKNSNGVLLLETAQPSEDVSKQISLQDLSSPYNDKLFEYSDKQGEKNLCKAWGVPLVLVSQNDNSMFGNSGEMLKEAKLQLWESKEEERNQLEEVFSMLMKLFQEKKRIDSGLEIGCPYVKKEDKKEE